MCGLRYTSLCGRLQLALSVHWLINGKKHYCDLLKLFVVGNVDVFTIKTLQGNKS